jgi:hypothetical protein
MPKFRFYFERLERSQVVEVEADNADEAREKCWDDYERDETTIEFEHVETSIARE